MYALQFYQVRDVMRAAPTTVRPEESLAFVEGIFERYNFNAIPVTDKSGHLLGMITKLDLLKAFDFGEKGRVPKYKEIMAKQVSEFMTSEVHTFSPETRLTEVLRNMIETRNKSFPVVEDKMLVGIIAREDVIRAIKKAGRGRLPAVIDSSSGKGFVKFSKTGAEKRRKRLLENCRHRLQCV